MVMDHQPLVRPMDKWVLTWVQTRWLRLGLFQSIRCTIKYQPRKANVLVNTLSWSQWKEAEDSMDDPVATVAVAEEQVSALNGYNIGVHGGRSSDMDQSLQGG